MWCSFVILRIISVSKAHTITGDHTGAKQRSKRALRRVNESQCSPHWLPTLTIFRVFYPTSGTQMRCSSCPRPEPVPIFCPNVSFRQLGRLGMASFVDLVHSYSSLKSQCESMFRHRTRHWQHPLVFDLVWWPEWFDSHHFFISSSMWHHAPREEPITRVPTVVHSTGFVVRSVV